MNKLTHPLNSGAVQLEIDTSVLLRLLEQGQICASEFHCLNRTSKHCVRELCLRSCKGD